MENALASHPAIIGAVTIAVPDDKWEERVHAVLILKEGFTVTLEDIQTHCRGLIGGYKIPRSMEIVESFPLSPQGKILKQQLRAPHWAGRSRCRFDRRRALAPMRTGSRDRSLGFDPSRGTRPAVKLAKRSINYRCMI